MSYTAEPKQQDTNIKVPLISKIAYGIDHGGHGRHLTLHIIKRRTVLSKCSFV